MDNVTRMSIVHGCVAGGDCLSIERNVLTELKPGVRVPINVCTKWAQPKNLSWHRTGKNHSMPCKTTGEEKVVGAT